MSPDQLLNSSVLKPVNLCVPPSPRLLSLSVSSPGENSSSLCAVPDSTQKWLEEQVGGVGAEGEVWQLHPGPAADSHMLTLGGGAAAV